MMGKEINPLEGVRAEECGRATLSKKRKDVKNRLYLT